MSDPSSILFFNPQLHRTEASGFSVRVMNDRLKRHINYSNCPRLSFSLSLPPTFMNRIFSSTGRTFDPLFAAATIGILLFAATASAQSKQTSFTDVSAGAWYEQAARDLIDAGALDASSGRFRPNDQATRAEMVELLVRLRNQPLLSPARGNFDDVSPSSSYYRYFETAARAGWVQGDGNCFGTFPCTARPYSGVNRAEAATLLMRVYALPSTGQAPVFYDNRNPNLWYHDTIQTAADHCVLQGDDLTKLVRPGSGMNRAEMIVMFERASSDMTYGIDCGTPTPVQGEISNVVAVSSTRIRLTFTTDLNTTRATDDFRYTVNAVGGGSISVTSAALIDGNTVDLTLASGLSNQTSYRVNAVDLTTAAGVRFSSNRTFLFANSQNVVLSVTALSATRVRVLFDTDMSAGTTDNANRYAVRTVSNNTPLGVYSAVMVDNRTVDLTLSAALQTNIPYLLNANDVVTQTGLHFYGSSTFTFGEPVADITGITPMTATVLRVAFSTDVQQTTSESVTRYRVTGNGRDLVVTGAHLVSNHLIDLTLGEIMENQRIYTVTVTDLRTAGGVLFTDTASTLYIGTDIRLESTLIGAREVPPVTVALSGTGTFTLTAAGLAYDLTLTNMTGSVVTGAHFHRGGAGVNGPVIQTITVAGNRATGSWTGLSEQDRNDLIGGGIYVNVHTQAHPDGAIRGQVVKQ
jgi:hypothetical protein